MCRNAQNASTDRRDPTMCQYESKVFRENVLLHSRIAPVSEIIIIFGKLMELGQINLLVSPNSFKGGITHILVS